MGIEDVFGLKYDGSENRIYSNGTASLSSDPRYGDEKIAYGYFLAAEYLAQDTVDINRCDSDLEKAIYLPDIPDSKLDLLIFPIAYLYRHFLEMAFKAILYRHEILSNIPRNKILEHGLKLLWDEIKDFVEKRTNKSEHDLMDIIGNVVMAFETSDDRSQSFRYERVDIKTGKKGKINSNGKSPFPEDTALFISIPKMKAIMRDIGSFLIDFINKLDVDIVIKQQREQHIK